MAPGKNVHSITLATEGFPHPDKFMGNAQCGVSTCPHLQKALYIRVSNLA